jgi:radical SAM superfamily enzyme YgiQ (UPF0313 family)
MPIKNIYFVQPGYSFGSGNGKIGAYIPYAAGAVAAYAWSNAEISTVYTLKDFIFLFEDINKKVDEMETPYLVAFSNYVWNIEYNKRFARRLKERYPECLVVFGGHQIPPDTSLLEAYDYIDFLVHGEGEEPFAALLSELEGNGDFGAVPGLSYRKKGTPALKNPEVFSPRADYPSPYITGIFNRLAENNGVDFYAIIETNRGCPHNCAFCDWGITKNKLKVFPKERVNQDIRWISAHKIEYCFAADANFGILDRDEKIADSLIESKQQTGYPARFDVTYAKGREDIVFRTAKKLFDAGMFKGPSLSFQSLCAETLDSVGRSNMTLEKFAGLLKRYSEAGITAYSEMILGLPGETYDSFCKGISTLLAYGQHYYIDIFRCELLVNAPMSNPAYIRKHGIKFVRTPSIQHHIKPRSDEIYGYSDIVVATNTMDTEMWIKANLFALFVQCCHHMGLLKYFAIYLYYANHIEYDDFYKSLLSRFENAGSGVCGRVYQSMRAVYNSFLETGSELSYTNILFGNITWFPEEGAFLEFVLCMEAFYKEATDFLREYDISPEIFEDLLLFQKNIVKRPGRNNLEIALQYDWHRYFSENNRTVDADPERKSNILHISAPGNPETWVDYARENVWFGRRAGRTVFLDGVCTIETEYLE